MQKHLLRLALFVPFLIAFGAGCAHHRDVRAGAEGIHRVVVRAQNQQDAEREAISQAEHYCEQTKRMPAFVEENTKYTGSMDEQTRDTVHKASTAAMILGGAGGVAGRGATRTGGGILGGAGTVGAIMTGGDDYTADMKFKCQ